MIYWYFCKNCKYKFTVVVTQKRYGSNCPKCHSNNTKLIKTEVKNDKNTT